MKVLTAKSDPRAQLAILFSKDNILIPYINSAPPFFNLKKLTEHFQFKHQLLIEQNSSQLIYALECDSSADPLQHAKWIPLKHYGQQLNQSTFNRVCRAKQLLHWDFSHQYCGRCGHPLTHTLSAQWEKHCQQCTLNTYPRLSPSILVLIHHNKTQLLLARSPHHTPGVYTNIGGFVEPGETAEETVHREVLEEVGVKIHNLKYYSSQHWPFPDSFMLGFFAEYLEGEIQCQPDEIEDAQWFSIDNLPPLPLPISLSRELIDVFVSTVG